jgi:hypothetical protein
MSATCVAAAFSAAGSSTSQAIAAAFPPSSRIDSTSGADTSTHRLKIATRAPAAAYAHDIATPRPTLPPVITAVWLRIVKRSYISTVASFQPLHIISDK